MADDVKIVVRADDQASPVFNKVGETSKKMGTDVGKASDQVVDGSKKMNKSLADNREGLIAVGAASGIAFAGLVSLGSMAIQQASKMQDLRIELDVLAGSAQKGGELFKAIQKEASKTPFESEDLTRATSTMLQFGIEQKNVMGNMRMLGDISGGNANKLQSLALVFGQVSSAGKLQGQDLLQLINLGFNPLKTMADRTGKSMSSLKDEMSDGKISFEMVQEEMRLATSEGGLFFGMMDKKSKTFAGVMSTLKDNVSIALASLGGFSNGEVVKGGLLDMLTKGMEKLMPMLDGVVQWAQKNPEMARNIFLVATALTGLIAGASALAFILPTLSAGVALIGSAFTALGAGIAFLFSPIGLIILAIAGLIAVGVLIYKNRETISAFAVSIWTGIANFFKATWEGIKNVASAIWEGIKMVFQVQLDLIVGIIGGFIGIFVGIFSAFLELLKGNWQGAWDIFSQTFVNVRNNIIAFITPLLELLQTLFSTTWNAISATFTRVWTGIKTFFTGTRESIKQTAVNAITWLKDFFSGGAKNMLEGAMHAMVSGFVGIVKGVLNGVIGGFEGMINFAIDGINKLIEAANSVSPITIGKVPRLALPRLAKGGIVDGSTMGELMGSFGHFARGGIVDGPMGVDKVPAMLSNGEVVLNQAQQGNLASFIRGNNGGSTIEVVVSGNSFYGDDASFAEKIGDTIVAQFRKHYAFEAF